MSSMPFVSPSRANLSAGRVSEIGLPQILMGIVLTIAAIDCVWAMVGRFDVDYSSYAKLALLSAALWLVSLYYGRFRDAPGIAAMLYGSAFLIVLSAGLSVLNYFLLTVAGPRIDPQLARLDAAIGINWPAMMAAVSTHPLVNIILRTAYSSVLPQVALLIIGLGWRNNVAAINAFCLALAMSAAVTIAFWTAFPSFGAFSVYELPMDVAQRVGPELDAHYARELVRLLVTGPGPISPSELKGLIGFPSFHAAMAVLVVLYGRSLPYACWAFLIWNLIVLVATPVHGGHFVVDVIAGAGVALAAAAATSRIAAVAERRERT
jgi:membrane-associated phospholipid phosphatase